MFQKSLVAVAGLIFSALLTAAPEMTGKWVLKLETPVGERVIPVMVTKVEGGSLSGKAPKTEKEMVDFTGTAADGAIKFEWPMFVEEASATDKMKIDGKVGEDGVLKGNWAWGEYSGAFSGKLEAGSAAPATAAVAGPNVAGKWKLKLETPIGDREFPVELAQNGTEVTTKFAKNDKGDMIDAKAPLANGGLKFSFPFESTEASMSATMTYEMKLKDDGTMGGTWTFGEYAGPLSMKKVE
jgi:hypothetical protein